MPCPAAQKTYSLNTDNRAQGTGFFAQMNAAPALENGVKEPLDTIDPSKLVLGLRYDKAGQYGGELTMTAVERKKRNPDRTAYYNPAGYTVFDLTAWYQYSKNLSFNAGVFNVFDRKYYQRSDVRSLSPNYAQIEAFSQPGRNAAVSMKYQF